MSAIDDLLDDGELFRDQKGRPRPWPRPLAPLADTHGHLTVFRGHDPARAVARAVPVPVIASGGVGNLEHFAEGVLEGEADAVLAASVFHFGTFSVRQVKEYMASQGIPVRLDF